MLASLAALERGTCRARYIHPADWLGVVAGATGRTPCLRVRSFTPEVSEMEANGLLAHPEETSLARMRVLVAMRNWWPVLACLAVVLVAQTVFKNSIVAIGQHATDHLRSAGALFPTTLLFTVIVWAALQARRHVDVWLAGAILGAAFALVMIGNLRVVHAIAGDAWTDAQAGALGSVRMGFDSGHSLASLGQWASAAAVILFTLVLLRRGIVRRRPAVGAIVLSLVLLPSPFIGLGMFVLAGDVIVQRAHRLKSGGKLTADPPAPPMSSS